MARDDPGRAEPGCVYIASHGHSGSTLLEMLLGRHPQVAAGGEIASLGLQCYRDENASWSGQCSCGVRPFDCPVWGRVLQRIREEHGVDMRRHPLRFPVSDIGLEEEYRRRAFRKLPLVWLRKGVWRWLRYQQYAGSRFMARACGAYEPQRVWVRNRTFVLRGLAEAQDRSVVVDSSKDPLDMRDLYGFSPMPVKVLFLTRDCRGNVWSFLRRNGKGRPRNRVVSRGAREWVSVNARIRKLLEGVHESDWMHVRYEDLCHDPERTLRAVFEFIGLAYEPGVLEEREHLEHTIAGNRIRFTNRHATIKEDTAWQKNLAHDDLDLVTRIAAPLARSFGYQI